MGTSENSGTDVRPAIFTVALTGGIASGKTAVSNRFAAHGVSVIDMDQIAHEIVAPGQPALKLILEAFGAKFLDQTGHLDRRKLRNAIFSNPDIKARLEAILHPLIVKEAMNRVRTARGPYCILVIPLFAESVRRDLAPWTAIDRVLVVDVDVMVQIERVTKRDGISHKQALAIVKTQASREERLALADDVIDNSGDLDDLQLNVDALHQCYLQLATIPEENQSRLLNPKFT